MRLGLFGGGFDPIHNGHLFIAETLRQKTGLERIIFLPTLRGRHRENPLASGEHRAAMIRLAIAGNPAFALDLTDLREGASGFTADLLPLLRARYPEDDFTFIAGGDSLVRSRWNRLDEILAALDAFVLAPRGDITEDELDAALADLPAALREKVRMFEMPRMVESATLIRARIAAGESIRYLVPEPVWRYVQEHALYAPVLEATR